MSCHERPGMVENAPPLRLARWISIAQGTIVLIGRVASQHLIHKGMADKKQKLEVVPPAEEPEEMPLPSDPKVIFLGGLFALALLAAVYVAAEIVLPLVLAVVLKLLLQPAMRLLERWHVPRMLAALLLILAVFGTIVGLGAAIAGPASTWAAKLPEGIPRLQERLSFLEAPINTLQRFLQQVEDYGQPAGAPAAVSAGGGHNRESGSVRRSER